MNSLKVWIIFGLILILIMLFAPNGKDKVQHLAGLRDAWLMGCLAGGVSYVLFYLT